MSRRFPPMAMMLAAVSFAGASPPELASGEGADSPGVPPSPARSADRSSVAYERAERAFEDADFIAERDARTAIANLLARELPNGHPDAVRAAAMLAGVEKLCMADIEVQQAIRTARQNIRESDTAARRGDRDAAVRLLRLAVDVYHRELGANDAMAAKLQARLGQMLITTGRHDDAVEALRAAERHLAASQGECNSLPALNSLTLAYLGGGNVEEAKRCGLRAAGLAREGWGEGSPLHAASVYNLALAYRGAGDLGLAVEAFAEAEQHAADDGAALEGWRLRCRIERARTLAAKGDVNAALPLFRESLTAAETLPPDDGSGLLEAVPGFYRVYAGVLMHAGHTEEAERALERAEALRR